MIPDTGIGAFPDLLGSSGTVNTPQIAASRIGIPKDIINLVQPSFVFHPHKPTEIKTIISKINLKRRLIECVPIFKVKIKIN